MTWLCVWHSFGWRAQPSQAARNDHDLGDISFFAVSKFITFIFVVVAVVAVVRLFFASTEMCALILPKQTDHALLAVVPYK